MLINLTWHTQSYHWKLCKGWITIQDFSNTCSIILNKHSPIIKSALHQWQQEMISWAFFISSWRALLCSWTLFGSSVTVSWTRTGYLHQWRCLRYFWGQLEGTPLSRIGLSLPSCACGHPLRHWYTVIWGLGSLFPFVFSSSGTASHDLPNIPSFYQPTMPT